MLKIQRFVCNMLQENCYVVSDETRECVIVDCGAYYEHEQKAIKSYIEREGLKPTHLLATHGHIDHNFGNGFIADTYGLKVEVPAQDEWLMDSLADQAVNFIGVRPTTPYPAVGRYLQPNDTIRFGSHTIERRTDFERGSMMQMMMSLHVLAQLPDETVVLAGHGEDTTIGDELRMNPFMDR